MKRLMNKIDDYGSELADEKFISICEKDLFDDILRVEAKYGIVLIKERRNYALWQPFDMIGTTSKINVVLLFKKWHEIIHRREAEECEKLKESF